MVAKTKIILMIGEKKAILAGDRARLRPQMTSSLTRYVTKTHKILSIPLSRTSFLLVQTLVTDESIGSRSWRRKSERVRLGVEAH